MTVAALPGNVRFRAFQLGNGVTFGTPVAATRRMPWRFNPTIDPHVTFPDIDTGTLDPATAPYFMAKDVTGQTTGPLAYNDAQIAWAALLKGGVAPTGGGAAKTWTFQEASTSADVFELFTAEWGDEVTGDQFRYGDGIIDRLQLTYPQDLGPVQIQADWRYASATYPNTMTAGLSVPASPAWVYAADTRLYIDSSAGSIGISPLTNTMHDATIVISANNDVKRFANGSNTRFNVAGYGRGPRTLETTFTLAKSVGALVEFADFLNASPIERFVALDTVSAEFITGTTPFSHRVKFAGYWFTRSESAVGSNSAAQLVCRHIYDTGLPSPIDVRVVNSAATMAPAT